MLHNTQIQCTPPPPQIRLLADLQQIESKAYLFTHRQAGQAPQRSVLLVSGSALVIVGYGLLLCLLHVRGLKVGNILVLHPTVLAVQGVILVLPALFVPNRPSYPFLVGTAQALCRPQCLGVEVFDIQDVIARSKMKHPGRTPGRPQSAWTQERSLPVQGLIWRPVWRIGPCSVRCRSSSSS